ncbi:MULTISPECIES: hypothetical protein [unclassified Nonomuraea]
MEQVGVDSPTAGGSTMMAVHPALTIALMARLIIPVEESMA